MIEQLVRPPTLTEAAADTLREAILRGDLQQGEPLREAALSESLGIAQGTVREALRALQDDGLVEVLPHRGVFVTTLSQRKVWEIYTLREQLEPYAVGLAMGNDAYDDAQLGEIDALLRHMGECDQQREDFERIKTDVAFHYQTCKPSEHQMLLDVLRSLQSLVTLCVTNLNVYDVDPLPQEPLHRAIFDAIRSGDVLHAQSRIREHLAEARDTLLAALIAGETAAE